MKFTEEPLTGKVYSGIGYSGLSEGVLITGWLLCYDKAQDSAILSDEYHRTHAVIFKTLKPFNPKIDAEYIPLKELKYYVDWSIRCGYEYCIIDIEELYDTPIKRLMVS